MQFEEPEGNYTVTIQGLTKIQAEAIAAVARQYPGAIITAG